MLSPHLTVANHEAALSRASGRSRREIEALVAELAPRPDVPTSVRKLPAPAVRSIPAPAVSTTESTTSNAVPASPSPASASPSSACISSDRSTPLFEAPASMPPRHRLVIEATSPERYRVQFTLGKEGHDRLRRLQELLRREIPNGDAAAIVDRALILLLAQVEKAKLGATAKPRPIRPGMDSRPRTPIVASRHIPRAVKRAAARRDGNQCTYVAPDGRRCSERSFLEFHHLRPYAQGGPATIDNITLRCRRHNQYEAELVFGARAANAATARPSPPTAAPHDPARPAAPGTARATPA